MLQKYIKELQDYGINLIDIGSSGSLDTKWTPIKDLINLVGFDPNKEECERQNKLPSQYKSSVFLPYAVHGKDGVETLYMTKSIYCYSLLKPNKQWLDRFSFHELFDVQGEEDIQVRAINNIEELKQFLPDVIKIDVQGLELPIFRKAGRLLDSAFYVETETGFTENYVGETTFSQLDVFMQANGFLMFDINVNHRVPRNNQFKDHPTGKEQILWAEAVWLKDYVGLDRQGKFDPHGFTDHKIKKILTLCALAQCYDFGFELAEFFHSKGLFSNLDLGALSSIEAWKLDGSADITENIEIKSDSELVFPKSFEVDLAPIVLFVFNRPDHTKRTLISLKSNPLAKESELFIFSDGPRDKNDEADVDAVRNLIDTLDGFKKITVVKKNANSGLAKSVIAGVTEVINKYGKAIVVEDDLLFSPYFLSYMNEALCSYEEDVRIFSVGGYSPPIPMPDDYKEDSYLSYRCCTWGWATWRDRWDRVDWDVKDFDQFINDPSQVELFNRGGDDMSQIFKQQMEGKISSWGIRWDYAHFKNDAYCFRPSHSIVGNTGNDGSGVHCAPTDAFDVSINLQSTFVFPKAGQLQLDEEINGRFATFYDGRPRNGSVLITSLVKTSLFRRMARRALKRAPVLRKFLVWRS
ncbi:FkbM family methyltransferase [Methylomonas sp. MK1]|uniref:FkbM family methyltransferase n=1 Tax=Methylomonas sp. MK1 TaxID=1131552 RepID=UPI000366BB07|nr:FkbM family methyltransferase [Methylomonas sp. MK1]